MIVNLPIPVDLFADLIAYLDGVGIKKKCDGQSLRYTTRFLKKQGIPSHDIACFITFCQAHGGYCDCEVLINVATTVFSKEEFVKYVTEARGRQAYRRQSSLPEWVRVSIGGGVNYLTKYRHIKRYEVNLPHL